MTIKKEAYMLCKTVLQSPARSKIKALVESLNRVPLDAHNTESDRSNFGYLARKYRMQFLGYLLVDRDREKIVDKNLPIHLPALREDERCVLHNIHKQILFLEGECLAPLKQNLPHSLQAVSPYSQGKVELMTEDSGDLAILSPKEISSFSMAFQQHTAFERAISASKSVGSNLSTPKFYLEQIMNLTNSLENSKDEYMDKVFSELSINHKIDSPVRMLMRHFLSLICIRNTLAVLNQLLFQAAFRDKLPCLCDTNIIELQSQHRDYLREGIQLLYQPDDKAGVEDAGTVVMVDYLIGGTEFKDLYRIEELTYKFSKSFGDTVAVKLQKIDDCLNPTSKLLAV